MLLEIGQFLETSLRRLFVGIYGGILCCILAVAGVSYGLLNQLNEIRYQQHLESNLRGTLFLINRGLSRQAEDQRRRWLDLVSQITLAPVALEDAGASSDVEGTRLRSAEAGTFLLQTPLLEQPEQLLTLKVGSLTESLATATAFLLLNELGRYEPAERQAVFDGIRGEIPYPVYRSRKAMERLTVKQRARIQRGEAVVEWGRQYDRGNWMQVYAPWGQTGDLLVLGPVALFEPYPLEILAAVSIVALLLITLTVFLFIRRVSRRLQLVQKTVDDINPDFLGDAPDYRTDDAIGLLNYKIHQLMVRIRRLLDEKAYMIRAISHDLRTPIAKMHFRLDEMQEQLGDDDDNVLASRNDLEQLNHLIDELLTYEKLSHDQQLEFRSVDVCGLLQDVIAEFARMNPALEIRLRSDVDTLAADVHGVLLRRLIENLLQNACRFADHRIDVYAQAAGSFVEIRLCDDGPGIDVDKLNSLFKPFYRADASRNSSSGGYGLGLAIVLQIVQQHNGEVSAHNRDGGGACFDVRLPLRQQTGPVQIESAAESAAGALR